MQDCYGHSIQSHYLHSIEYNLHRKKRASVHPASTPPAHYLSPLAQPPARQIRTKNLSILLIEFDRIMDSYALAIKSDFIIRMNNNSALFIDAF